MPTQLELCNRALGLIGQLRITNIEATNDPASIALNRHWDEALNEFLAECFWPWAKTRDTLTEESPAPSFGWEHKFALPSDFISLVGLNETYADTPSDVYEIEGGYILTDDNVASEPAQVNIEYIAKPTDSGLETFLARMDPKAANAFQTLLASKVAPALAEDGLTKSNVLLQRYHTVDLPKARVRALNQNRPPPRFPFQTSSNLQQRRSFENRE